MSNIGHAHKTAVLIACKNGEATIATAVGSAACQADVYVVSDGSDDRTVELARRAGAWVAAREHSGGKPAALRHALTAFDLEQYDYIVVVDDDTTLDPDYVELVTRVMDDDPSIAAASGRIDSLWDRGRRWNVPIAARAFMYWSYQATIKRGQNALRIVNLICGANSVFRADVFRELIVEDAPYAIDDMYWTAEIMRRRLGRIAYVHDARSWTIDPHRLSDWYRQTVRWGWGQFQSVRGHRLGAPVRRDAGGRFGVRWSWFDLGYLALLIDWLPYMVAPLALPLLAIFLSRWVDPIWFPVYYVAGTLCWIAVGAAALRRPRLLVLAPALLVMDLFFRVAMAHAVAKALVIPRVAVCAWDSPTRFQTHPTTTDWRLE